MPEESVNPAAQEYYCRLTDAGAALEAAAHAEALPVTLTHVAVGDGGGEVPAPAASATALVHEVYRRQIDGRERDKEDPNIAWLHIIIPADVGGFWIREFGIYAQPLTEGGEPVLYAVGNHAPYYKQQAAQGQATTHELSIPVILSGTAEVEISVRDAGYASQLAFEDLRATVESDRERLWENDGEGPKVLGGVLPLATAEQPGVVRPDGDTVTVDEEGMLSALGGNLQLNSKIVITESGGFTVPRTGWYAVICIGGGAGGYVNTLAAYGGPSGAIARGLVYLGAGDEVPVVVGAGGLGIYKPDAAWSLADKASTAGGSTSFGGHVLAPGGGAGDVEGTPQYAAGSYGGVAASGAGVTAFDLIAYGGSVGYTYGFGGNSRLAKASGVISAASHADSGEPGAIILRYNDPGLAAGPKPAPALLSARRGAARPSAPVTVNLYDPAAGQGSVWREEDAEAKLAEGLVSEEAWTETCAARAAEEYDAWLASPDTEAERFGMLRAARDAKLAATDYLVAPDYPLTDGQRAAVTAYRQALRDLPAEEGAPWDGGGELTPWPEMPTVEKAREA